MRIVLFSVLIMEMSAKVRFVWKYLEDKTRMNHYQRGRQGRTVLETEFCKYLFNPDGSCVVQYEGPQRPGKVTGRKTVSTSWSVIIASHHRKLPPSEVRRRLLRTAERMYQLSSVGVKLKKLNKIFVFGNKSIFCSHREPFTAEKFKFIEERQQDQWSNNIRSSI